MSLSCARFVRVVSVLNSLINSNSPRKVKVFRTVLITIYHVFAILTDPIEQIHLIKPVKFIKLIEMTGSLMILKMFVW